MSRVARDPPWVLHSRRKAYAPSQENRRADARILSRPHERNENSKNQTPGTQRPTRFYFLVTYWGNKFRERLCRFTFPSLLVPGNIPALRYPKDAKLIIATTRDDWQVLRKERIYARPREHIQVEVLRGSDEVPRDEEGVEIIAHLDSQGGKKLAETEGWWP